MDDRPSKLPAIGVGLYPSKSLCWIALSAKAQRAEWPRQKLKGQRKASPSSFPFLLQLAPVNCTTLTISRPMCRRVPHIPWRLNSPLEEEEEAELKGERVKERVEGVKVGGFNPSIA